MANTLTSIAPQLLAQGFNALREAIVMPMLVNRDLEGLAAQKGDSITIPIPSAVTVANVTPAPTPPATADQTPTTAVVPLDQWKEAAFHMSDKDLMTIQEGFLPAQASEAISALASTVDDYLWGLYTAFYGAVGTAGTTPFATTLAGATSARRLLNEQKANMAPRALVLDNLAEENALNLRAIQDASFGAGSDTILNGQIGRRLGFTWVASNNAPTHTPGTAASVQTAAAGSVGDTTIAVDTGTGTYVVGDIVTFAGHSQQYVITVAHADVSTGTITFSPGLVAAVADNEAIANPIAAHTVNLAMHRDAIAFATRPLANSGNASELGSIVETISDPISGLTLRLEITREHKRDRYAYDILYGAVVARPALGVRLLG